MDGYSGNRCKQTFTDYNKMFSASNILITLNTSINRPLWWQTIVLWKLFHIQVMCDLNFHWKYIKSKTYLNWLVFARYIITYRYIKQYCLFLD